tara:strand:- start:604 stop:714 length:111 start_codon:yes stop_codon:yes gene_type:complete
MFGAANVAADRSKILARHLPAGNWRPAIIAAFAANH